MPATLTQNAIGTARRIAREHRAAWRAESGYQIEQFSTEEIGDWDSTGWAVAWQTILRETDDQTDLDQLCRECNDAYFAALFGK